MKKVRLLLSYDGTNFKGWQKQKNTSQTIQGLIEKALFEIFSTPISLIGSGRTDTGVHARAQVAHFTLPSSQVPKRLVQRLNSLTPSSISFHRAWLAPLNFHAQMSALQRMYRYFILNTPTPSVFNQRYTLWHPQPLHLENLNLMAQELIGEKDFKSFQNKGTIVSSTVRKVFSAQWYWQRHLNLFVFQIEANSFLKQMVRNLVGTQLRLMNTENGVQKIRQILKLRARKEAFQTSSPQGLFLYRVSYPSSLDIKCQRI